MDGAMPDGTQAPGSGWDAVASCAGSVAVVSGAGWRYGFTAGEGWS